MSKEDLERFKDPNVMITSSGKYFNIAGPRKKDVNIIDFSKHLSKMCRWSGAVETFYSVAEHSIFVHNIVWKLTHGNKLLCLTGLLHDAHETYVGDIIKPMSNAVIARKRLFSSTQEKTFNPISHIKECIDEQIAIYFKEEYGIILDFTNPVIKKADNIAQTWEALNVVEHYPVETLEPTLRYMVEQMFPQEVKISEKPSFVADIFHGMLTSLIDELKVALQIAVSEKGEKE